MPFDFKKELKNLYSPSGKPEIILVPPANFLAVYGKGNPNEEGGEYKQAVELLYGAAYTIKMSPKNNYNIEGFFDYVVPPLEGLWRSSNDDLLNKDELNWISLIRLPDFVKESDVLWAKATAAQKKKTDFSAVLFFSYDEGLCVQCLHIGPYDDEPKTINNMRAYAEELGYAIDITPARHHHEIYLSNPNNTEPSKLKTIIRLPIKK
jgi:hypothetical protein